MIQGNLNRAQVSLFKYNSSEFIQTLLIESILTELKSDYANTSQVSLFKYISSQFIQILSFKAVLTELESVY